MKPIAALVAGLVLAFGSTGAAASLTVHDVHAEAQVCQGRLGRAGEGRGGDARLEAQAPQHGHEAHGAHAVRLPGAHHAAGAQDVPGNQRGLELLTPLGLLLPPGLAGRHSLRGPRWAVALRGDEVLLELRRDRKTSEWTVTPVITPLDAEPPENDEGLHRCRYLASSCRAITSEYTTGTTPATIKPTSATMAPTVPPSPPPRIDTRPAMTIE